MPTKFPDIQDILLKDGLYVSYELSKELFKEIYSLEYFIGTIDAFCVECKEKSIFEGANITHENIHRVPQCVYPRLNVALINNKYVAQKDDFEDVKSLINRLFVTTLQCTRRAHFIKYIFLINNNTLIKIGQYPSIADMQILANEKYKKNLGKKYTELNKAIGLNAHGVGIGSFVYLRRIFETLIEEAFNSNSGSINMSASDFQTKRMGEKIKILKSFLPLFLVENSSLYSILSKGIHSLTEEECKKYFNTVKVGIELILDEKLEKESKQKKLDSISKEINDIKKNI
jgi:hypothetical protein